MSAKAEARLIYNSISVSERIAKLGAKGALLFTWLITHCDPQGRMQGKPRILKNQVVPFLDEVTEDVIEEMLKLMEEAGLIILYKDNDDGGRLLLQVKDWWKWQTGLRYKPASKYIAPDDWKDIITSRSDDGKFEKDNKPDTRNGTVNGAGREEKRSEENRKKQVEPWSKVENLSRKSLYHA
ncbi:hypothetical protein ACFLW0_00930 [Chloroflexota bacterium]